MDLYLVQHGEQVPKDQDPEKPLSDRGQGDVKRVSAFLKAAGVSFDRVVHSGKLRARQTAELLTAELAPGLAPEAEEGLSPLDDVKATAKGIPEKDRNTMIVGHLPHLGKLASFLVTGSEEPLVATFQQGGVVCLRWDEDNGWTFAWMVVPEILKS